MDVAPIHTATGAFNGKASGEEASRPLNVPTKTLNDATCAPQNPSSRFNSI